MKKIKIRTLALKRVTLQSETDNTSLTIVYILGELLFEFK